MFPSLLGYEPRELERQITQWNQDMAMMNEHERLHLYDEMCQTSKEKLVPGLDLVRSRKPGGDWVYRCHLSPVMFTKKEREILWPPSTTDTEGAAFDAPPGDTTVLDYEPFSSSSSVSTYCLNIL